MAIWADMLTPEDSRVKLDEADVGMPDVVIHAHSRSTCHVIVAADLPLPEYFRLCKQRLYNANPLGENVGSTANGVSVARYCNNFFFLARVLT